MRGAGCSVRGKTKSVLDNVPPKLYPHTNLFEHIDENCDLVVSLSQGVSER